QPIFTSRCAVSGCHTGAFPSQGLDLSAGNAYAAIVNVGSTECGTFDLIEPSNGGASYLLFKVQGSGPGFLGSQMPLTGGPPPAMQIATISNWVSQGALNN